MKGRKPKQDSRADEIRARLVAWEQESESARPSLRSLARDLGTSHQLLSHYIEGLGVWQAKRQMAEYRRLKDEAEASAKAERRPLTPQEDEQMCFYGRKWVDHMLVVALEQTLMDWRRQARNRKLKAKQVKMLEELASDAPTGLRGRARKILALNGTEKIKK
jgi:transposase-like protein